MIFFGGGFKTETTLKCQWVIEECAHDGNVSTEYLKAIMSNNWNPQICHLYEKTSQEFMLEVIKLICC